MTKHPTPARLLIASLTLALATASCAPVSEETLQAEKTANAHRVAVDPSHFIAESLIGEVVQEERELADGSTALCYVFSTRSTPNEHEMGPWAPRHIDDGPDAGGIWVRDGKVYDVDGPFVRDAATFYDDAEWKLTRDDGTVKVTDTKEAFEAAARPDVDPKYQNHVVEGRPEWIKPFVTTYAIPVTPTFNPRPTRFGRFGRHGSAGGVAVAFNGVGFDPPAPLHAILGAHTLAPFDDAGGHLNPHVGYHYHAATGHTKEIAQDDRHAPQIGYALDGFGLFAHLDPEGRPATGLDACGGHVDEIRGYHYHAGAAGGNQIIKSFRGVPGTMTVEP